MQDLSLLSGHFVNKYSANFKLVSIKHKSCYLLEIMHYEVAQELTNYDPWPNLDCHLFS